MDQHYPHDNMKYDTHTPYLPENNIMPQSLLLKQFPLCHFKFMQSIFYVMKSKSKCWCEKEEEMPSKLWAQHRWND